MVGQWGFVVVLEEFQLSFAVIEDLKKEHPHQLANTLRVAIDADIFAHDVLDGLDDPGNVAHADLSCLKSSCSSSWMTASNLSLPPKMLLMISTGVPMDLKGSSRRTFALSRVPIPSSAY